MTDQPLTCPACGGMSVSQLLRVGEVPVACNVPAPTREAAVSVARGLLDLAACDECTLVYNTDFDAGLIPYEDGYENSLHHSGSFEAFAVDTARRLVERHDIRQKTVFEVGCGDGGFLRLICDAGGNRGIGLEPSVPESLEISPTITILRSAYNEALVRDSEPDLVCSRHVLEHLPDPGEHLESLGRALAPRPDSVLYLEVPDAAYTIRDLGIWDLIYEHSFYFTAPALRRLVARVGLEPLTVETGFGGQFLAVEARAGRGGNGVGGQEPELEGLRDALTAFPGRYADKVRDWERVLGDADGRGERVALWGAGSKGVMFLNLVAGAEAVSRVIDINPKKQGNFVPGTGHEITPPEALARDGADLVIVMNPNYVDEIAASLAALGLHPRLLTA